MKNKKSLVDMILGTVIFLVFFLMMLKMTGLYEPFIKTIRYLPDFLKDIVNSWKAGVK